MDYNGLDDFISNIFTNPFIDKLLVIVDSYMYSYDFYIHIELLDLF